MHVTKVPDQELKLILDSAAAQMIEQADRAKLEADRSWRELSDSSDSVKDGPTAKFPRERRRRIV